MHMRSRSYKSKKDKIFSVFVVKGLTMHPNNNKDEFIDTFMVAHGDRMYSNHKWTFQADSVPKTGITTNLVFFTSVTLATLLIGYRYPRLFYIRYFRGHSLCYTT